MKLYIKYISIQLRSQMQYKASFAMSLATQFIQPFAQFAGIYLLFERFGSIKGWTLYEVFLCYSVVGACLAVSTCFARGFDVFPGRMVKSAAFDRVLVRPRGEILQVLGSELDLKRMGYFLQTLIVLVVAVVRVDVIWTPAKALTLLNMLIGGSLIFSGVYMLQAAAAFWTVESLEVAAIFTHGIKEHASYPLNIFPRWITVFFTFVVPFGTINYLPLQYLLGRQSGGVSWLYAPGLEWLNALIPLMGALFILPCLWAWRAGVRKYSSTGS